MLSELCRSIQNILHEAKIHVEGDDVEDASENEARSDEYDDESSDESELSEKFYELAKSEGSNKSDESKLQA